MAQATLWFASPFNEWIGRRTLTLSWEGQETLRQIFLRLQTDYPGIRTHLPPDGLHDETLSQVLVVILDGNFLSLDSVIPDGAKLDILTPLAGGAPTHSSNARSGRRTPPRLDAASGQVLGIEVHLDHWVLKPLHTESRDTGKGSIPLPPLGPHQ